jgi:hypothetical protein
LNGFCAVVFVGSLVILTEYWSMFVWTEAASSIFCTMKFVAGAWSSRGKLMLSTKPAAFFKNHLRFIGRLPGWIDINNSV